ncbi:hypothetical protein ALC56_08190, partial [Trachymyrmex septentrionalis]
FDGSALLREFFAQFDLIAHANRWEVDMEATVLASCLRGKARGIIRVTFRRSAQSLQNYYSQFTNRKQKFGESIASFVSDIERLSQLAYPELACSQYATKSRARSSSPFYPTDS